jgi:hypothetical protein
MAQPLGEAVAEHFRRVSHRLPQIGGWAYSRRAFGIRHSLQGNSMLRIIRLGSIGLLFGALVAACGSARLVDRSQYGGTIALNGDREKAMEQANQMMAQHCGPGNYQVVHEGEVPVGTDTYSQTNTNYGESTQSNRSGTQSNTEGGATSSSGTSTRTATEWRIQYQCGGAPAAGTAGPGGPGGPPPGPPPGPAPDPNAPPPPSGY